MITLSPAYGRDYNSKQAVVNDFNANKDFIIETFNHKYSGKPANKTDLANDLPVKVRYKNKTMETILKGNEPTKEIKPKTQTSKTEHTYKSNQLVFDKTNLLTKDVYWLTSIKPDKQDTRRYRNTILIDKNCMFSCDGWRLFRIKNVLDNWKNGIYKVVTRRKTLMVLEKLDVDNDWPDVWDVYPDIEKPFEMVGFSPDTIDGDIKQFMLALSETDKSICVKWLIDCITDDFTCYIADQEGNKPFTFKSGNKTALIMPKLVK